MTDHVAIIGAGMAGLAAARLLDEAGVACTIFDKSRGVGGRMSTRRVDGLQFDHGAQYFTARNDRFARLVEGWRSAASVAEWLPGTFVGTPGMTGPARRMAESLEVNLACEITRLRRGRDGWSLFAGDNLVAFPRNGAFDTVILALPAPQIASILESCAVTFPELARVRYAPCWALMLAYAQRSGLSWTHRRADGDDLAWIARDATKPGRPSESETFVVHAGADWSNRNLELSREEAAADLLALFRRQTGVAGEPFFAAAHRWRFALVQETAGAPFLWDDTARIGACGDWCLGPRVEAAFESGEAMARACLSSLENSRVS
jgi:renalase